MPPLKCNLKREQYPAIKYIYTTYNIYRTTILLLYIQGDPFKCLRYALFRKVSTFFLFISYNLVTVRPFGRIEFLKNCYHYRVLSLYFDDMHF